MAARAGTITEMLGEKFVKSNQFRWFPAIFIDPSTAFPGPHCPGLSAATGRPPVNRRRDNRPERGKAGPTRPGRAGQPPAPGAGGLDRNPLIPKPSLIRGHAITVVVIEPRIDGQHPFRLADGRRRHRLAIETSFPIPSIAQPPAGHQVVTSPNQPLGNENVGAASVEDLGLCGADGREPDGGDIAAIGLDNGQPADRIGGENSTADSVDGSGFGGRRRRGRRRAEVGPRAAMPAGSSNVVQPATANIPMAAQRIRRMTSPPAWQWPRPELYRETLSLSSPSQPSRKPGKFDCLRRPVLGSSRNRADRWFAGRPVAKRRCTAAAKSCGVAATSRQSPTAVSPAGRGPPPAGRSPGTPSTSTVAWPASPERRHRHD